MSKHKLNKLALCLAVTTLPVMTMSGCVTVKDYYQQYFGMDKSTRETTGYYEHTESAIRKNTIIVPAGLDNPGTNPELVVPYASSKELAQGPVGENMDIRPPIAPFRSENGLRSEWNDGEAIVWFSHGGPHGVNVEDDAWMLLADVLKHMYVAVGKIAPGEYMLTTIARDFTEFGKPYDGSDADMGLKRYNQIYQIRVGRNANHELGIATKLVMSRTSLSMGMGVKDLLGYIEQERFAMGFANHIIHEIESKNQQKTADAESLVITLELDENEHQAIMLETSFEQANSLIRGVFDRCGWNITKHLVSNSIYEVEVKDNSDNWTNAHDYKLINIPLGKYKIRLGLVGNRTAITFYDEKDNPLSKEQVGLIYSGFAEAFAEEFRSYKQAQAFQK